MALRYEMKSVLEKFGNVANETAEISKYAAWNDNSSQIPHRNPFLHSQAIDKYYYIF